MTVYLTRQGRGEALVFFHGWGFDHQVWNALLPDLTEDFEVYCVDLPGFGHTPWMAWEDFKVCLLEKLPPYFHVLGWSLGGLYATRLAIEAPKYVLKLVNVAASPLFIEDGLWPGLNKAVFRKFYESIMLDANKVLEQFISLQSRGLMSFKVNTAIPTQENLQKGLEILTTWDLRNALSTLTKPACYMFGRLDAITPIRTMHVMQVNYPQFDYVVFKRAAHVPFISHQENFIKSLKDYLQ